MSIKLQGILAPLTTPFAADGSLALDKLRTNVARYNRTKLAGYVVIGSSGESVLLSFDEITRIWGAIREAASPGKVLIAGTGMEATAETVARTRAAAALGYHAVLVKTPHYFKSSMTAEALEKHYRTVADTSPIPVLLYNIPQHTGVCMTPDLVARLATHPNVVGIRESSGDVSLMAEIVQSTPASFQALAGSSSALLGSLSVGAVGGILALACFLPELSIDLYEAWRAGESARARKIQHSILAPSRIVVGELGPAGVKYGMDCADYFGGSPRLPLLPLTEAQKSAVQHTLSVLRPGAARAQSRFR
jgi:4-hydroxy-2-oxoglutarate aldolase